MPVLPIGWVPPLTYTSVVVPSTRTNNATGEYTDLVSPLVADVFMGATFCFGPTTSAMASLLCLPRWYRPQSYFDSGTVLTTWYSELAWLEFSSAYWSLPFDPSELSGTYTCTGICR